MDFIKQWLNKSTKPTTKENTFTPAMGVNDAYRKQYFGKFDANLMQEIRRVKLNEGK